MSYSVQFSVCFPMNVHTCDLTGFAPAQKKVISAVSVHLYD